MRLNQLFLRAVMVVIPAVALAQSEARPIQAILSQEIVPVEVRAFQLREYLLTRVAKAPVAKDAKTWAAESGELRRRLLQDVVFHGWPPAWVTAPPRFEEVGVIPGKGYRIRKLRYEIVPGFYSAALLYEPERKTGNMPAVLNVNGHVGTPGKTVEYKQKRCINMARNGIIALNLEWLGFGELSSPENSHWYAGHLDLTGRAGLGIFYLAMSKGLDYLFEMQGVDRSRIGMTGLSGGGWQTIVLSALDERIRVVVPVAGFSSLASRIEVNRYGDVGDPEQSASDLLKGLDYTHLLAMLAPRPVLLAYNAEDDCCFRAAAVKTPLWDTLRQVYGAVGAPQSYEWHENHDPGTHNYQLDNRLAAYRFFSRHFNLSSIESEAGVDGEVKSYDELVVGLPANNLTMLELARRFARERQPVSETGKEARKKLTEVVRYRPVSVARAWLTAITKSQGVESKSYAFRISDGLSAMGTWIKSISAPADASPVIVLHDGGRPAAVETVSDRVNRGEQVMALDLSFMGEQWQKTNSWGYEQMLYGIGDRPLGMEAAQLIAVAKWLGSGPDRKVVLDASGVRSQTIALVAAALSPEAFAELKVRDGVQSLAELVDKPIGYAQAHDLFCLDLLKFFDIDSLTRLAEPVSVK